MLHDGWLPRALWDQLLRLRQHHLLRITAFLPVYLLTNIMLNFRLPQVHLHIVLYQLFITIHFILLLIFLKIPIITIIHLIQLCTHQLYHVIPLQNLTLYTGLIRVFIHILHLPCTLILFMHHHLLQDLFIFLMPRFWGEGIISIHVSYRGYPDIIQLEEWVVGDYFLQLHRHLLAHVQVKKSLFVVRQLQFSVERWPIYHHLH